MKLCCALPPEEAESGGSGAEAVPGQGEVASHSLCVCFLSLGFLINSTLQSIFKHAYCFLVSLPALTPIFLLIRMELPSFK